MTILSENSKKKHWENVLNSDYTKICCLSSFKLDCQITVHIKSHLRCLKPWKAQGLIKSTRNKGKLFKTVFKKSQNEKALFLYTKKERKFFFIKYFVWKITINKCGNC